MKPNSQFYFRAAFTLVEMLVLIAIVALLGLVVYPSYLVQKDKAQRIRCTSHMKQTGLAFRIWAGDHDDKNPFHLAVTNGGTKEFIATGETFRHFEIMSNELNTPKILVCPADKQRVAATSFTPMLSNSNLSYFVGIEAEDVAPGRFLSGDRNIFGRDYGRFEFSGVPRYQRCQLGDGFAQGTRQRGVSGWLRAGFFEYSLAERFDLHRPGHQPAGNALSI